MASQSGGTYFTDKYFLLTTDIDLNNKALNNGICLNYFGGTLDGDGHEIKGIKINQTGLANVGFIRFFKGTIKNLKLTGSVTGANTSDKSNIGGFVAKAEAACTISNCVNNIDVTGGYCVGGFIGQVYPSAAATVKIYACTNEGVVKSTTTFSTTASNTGGFIGYVGQNATVNFGYSQNNEFVTAGAIEVAGYVGGNFGSLSFDHCINRGAIKAGYAAGGFMG